MNRCKKLFFFAVLTQPTYFVYSSNPFLGRFRIQKNPPEYQDMNPDKFKHFNGDSNPFKINTMLCQWILQNDTLRLSVADSNGNEESERTILSPNDTLTPYAIKSAQLNSWGLLLVHIYYNTKTCSLLIDPQDALDYISTPPLHSKQLQALNDLSISPSCLIPVHVLKEQSQSASPDTKRFMRNKKPSQNTSIYTSDCS